MNTHTLPLQEARKVQLVLGLRGVIPKLHVLGGRSSKTESKEVSWALSTLHSHDHFPSSGRCHFLSLVLLHFFSPQFYNSNHKQDHIIALIETPLRLLSFRLKFKFLRCLIRSFTTSPAGVHILSSCHFCSPLTKLQCGWHLNTDITIS